MKSLFLIGVALCVVSVQAFAAGKPPNIILIITDDQGYGDVSAHGNPILQTPQLDRLHAASVRFTGLPGESHLRTHARGAAHGSS
jgi:hypothetical protein